MKICFLTFCCFLAMISCKPDVNSEKYSPVSYAKTKENLALKEKKNPVAFLSVSGIKKTNLIGQTVIRGKISNHASVVSYKDINVLLSFYSKTGTLLEKDNETVYENIGPGKIKKFKTKYFAPKGTDSVGYEIVSAKVNQ